MEDFRFNLDLNLTSNFVLTKHALPHLEKTRGNIVYISSVAGIILYEQSPCSWQGLAYSNLRVYFSFQEKELCQRVQVTMCPRLP